MNKKPKNIEQLYSESFNDFRMEPSSGLWKKISSKLAWKNFISFNPTTINAYYLTGILAVSIAGALWITNPVTENNQEIKEITINNTIANPVITSVQEESRKSKVKTEEQRSNKDMKPVPKPALSAEALAKADSSAIVTTKAENQKPESGINDRSNQQPVTSNQQPDSGINDPKPVTRNTQLVTLNPKPVTPDLQPLTRNTKLVTLSPLPSSSAIVTTKTEKQKLDSGINDRSNQQPVTSNQQPVTSNQSPEPWPDPIDPLFTNNSSTPPQHTIEFPNAFTPNQNGPTNGYYTPGLPNNDVFHPEYKGVVEYHLRIFNRRGELIFESNDINRGWDGYINASLAAQDVYVWKASGRYSNGQSFVKFGNVMLIKK